MEPQAELLFETYVANRSPMEVNVSAKQRAQLAASIKMGVCTPTMFNECQREVGMGLQPNTPPCAAPRTDTPTLLLLVLLSTPLADLPAHAA